MTAREIIERLSKMIEEKPGLAEAKVMDSENKEYTVSNMVYMHEEEK